MNQERLLWRLQELKQEEAVLLKSKELKLLSNNLKGLQEKVKKGEEEIKTLRAKINQGNKKSTELEKDANGLFKQIQASKEKLYGAKGGSLKELLSWQQSVLKLETQEKETENRYWDKLKEIEEYKSEKEKVKKNLRDLKKEYNEGVRQYNEIKTQLDWQLLEIKSKQEEVWEQLLPEVLKLYEEVEKRYPLNFMAKLHKNVCLGCRISVSSRLVKQIKDGKGFYHCENCGRILIDFF
jgi:predicted  nucleic acid-binding Zn-ribbon protein